MHEHLKSVLASLKARIHELRVEHNRHLPAPILSGGEKVARSPRLNKAQRQKVRAPAAELRVLVPLYTALVGMSQQPLNHKSSGVRTYVKRFEGLRTQLQLEAASHRHPLEIFSRQLTLLDAGGDVEPASWKAVGLEELQRAAQEWVDGCTKERTRRQLAAEGARKDFLASLSSEQVALLAGALAAAKAKGTHAVTFFESDLR